MFDGLIQDFVLKVKARTGASQEVLVLGLVALFFSIIAIVFLSIGAYVWLADVYGGAIAGAAVGGFHAFVTLCALGRCVAARRRNAALALIEMKAAEKRAAWWTDPAVLALGYEAVRLVGLRKLAPLLAAGALAVTLGGSHRGERRASNGSRPET